MYAKKNLCKSKIIKNFGGFFVFFGSFSVQPGDLSEERLGRGCGGQWEVLRCWVDEGALWLRNSVNLAVLSTGKQKERIPSSNGIVFQFFLAASCSNWRGAISPFFWLLSATNQKST